ncbi:uncharacterized protein LOC132790611 [Drosophila nasuta]|uniref:uncharacterized protein LOC132790611 n=1 Tax=Drosophila nasuta TaxID=42062 RepID=UPI00295E971E|nr:uncharacterized protein LOC132790611 [Drosophila nasuta]
MHSNISIVLVLLLGCFMQTTYSEDPTTNEPTTIAPEFSCTTHNGLATDLEAIAGSWYEAARASDEDDAQCLKYSIEATPDGDNRINIKLEYVSTVDGKWEPEIDSALLPWDDNAKNGIFSWTNDETSETSVTFKMVSMDNSSYAFLCGYKGIASVPLFKVLTRERALSSDQKTLIEEKFNDLSQNEALVWVEQSEQKCNSAMRSIGQTLLVLLSALLIFQ